MQRLIAANSNWMHALYHINPDPSWHQQVQMLDSMHWFNSERAVQAHFCISWTCCFACSLAVICCHWTSSPLVQHTDLHQRWQIRSFCSKQCLQGYH